MNLTSACDFNSTKLLTEKQNSIIASPEILGAIEIGEIAKLLRITRNLSVAIEVRLDNCTVYHVSFLRIN